MSMRSSYVQNEIACKPLFIRFLEESKNRTLIEGNEKFLLIFMA